MTNYTRFLPRIITVLALLATAALMTHYTTSLRAYRRMTEASSLINHWSAAMVELSFQDATGATPTLPCPAITQRIHDGRHATYTLAATITRTQAPQPGMAQPEPTCDDTPYYLLEITSGWDTNPQAVRVLMVQDMLKARENPELLMLPYLRNEPVPYTVAAGSRLEAHQ